MTLLWCTLACLSAGSTALIPDAPASLMADGRLIAFERSLGPHAPPSIYVMSADGSGLRKLAAGCCLEWSPDGTRIAFFRPSGRLWVIDVDGSDPNQLTAIEAVGELDLTWSPDGKQIAFAGPYTRLSDSAIYVVNSDGSGLARLTAPRRFLADTDPEWSPDGSQIAFDERRQRCHLDEP